VDLLKPGLLWPAAQELAESPVWHDGALWWVNITAGELHRLALPSGTHAFWTVGRMAGAAVPDGPDHWLVAAQDGYGRLHLRTGAWEPLVRPPAMDEGQRFNDGKLDPAGRFVAGTLDLQGRAGRCALYALERDGTCRVLLEGIGLSNGLDWSLDGRLFYHVDTLERVVMVYDYDVDAGKLGAGRVLVRVPPEHGYPDGLVLDKRGGLWVAMWEGGALRRYDARSGDPREVLCMPVSRPTSCVFGPDGAFYITSAWQGMTQEARSREPLAGSVFWRQPS
jgi:sugar lactone lactonase YvrE